MQYDLFRLGCTKKAWLYCPDNKIVVHQGKAYSELTHKELLLLHDELTYIIKNIEKDFYNG